MRDTCADTSRLKSYSGIDVVYAVVINTTLNLHASCNNIIHTILTVGANHDFTGGQGGVMGTLPTSKTLYNVRFDVVQRTPIHVVGGCTTWHSESSLQAGKMTQ